MPETWQEYRDSEIAVYERPLIHDSFRSVKSDRRERRLTNKNLLTGLSSQKTDNFPEPEPTGKTNPSHDF
ncbi:MAG: hypothetical protein NTW35_00725 [Candidatus Nomurabacteria bacterium]|nr:hypothetical protein [Candidatus Nomurabacteria bacterium]